MTISLLCVIPVKIYGILVVYSPQWRQIVESEFRSYVASLGYAHEIVVVNNGPALRHGDVCGDNFSHEFSGWNTGLSTIRPAACDFIFFANDTFCTRNSWNWLVRRRFTRGFHAALAAGRPAMIGEVSRFAGEYCILGRRASFWIRTHLFGATAACLALINRPGLDSEELTKMLTLDEDRRAFVWNDGVSQNLRTRIDEWLFPAANAFGWYRARSSSMEVKLRKAWTILNENWLGACAAADAVSVIDCGPSTAEKMCRNAYSRFRQRVLRK